MSNETERQRVWDIMVSHLLTQRARSLTDPMNEYPNCAYRGEEGRRCAVGALVPPEIEMVEHASWSCEGNLRALIEAGVDFGFDEDFDLTSYADQTDALYSEVGRVLEAARRTHDNLEPVLWEEALRQESKRLRLEFRPPALSSEASG